MSQNLSDHSLSAECNPGGGTNCPCSQDDASILSFADFGEVTSNPLFHNTYVNAIGFRKFTEVLPDGTPLSLGVYRYVGQIRLPVLPQESLSQIHNPQAVHMMLQFWDGRDALYPAGKKTLEGAIYWSLNPWDTTKYGKIMVYSGSLDLLDTGINLAPDTNWHTFELVVDLKDQKYLSISIDGKQKELMGTALAQVSHPEWGSDVSFSMTTESMAAWPQYTCTYVFSWSTQFRDVELDRLE